MNSIQKRMKGWDDFLVLIIIALGIFAVFIILGAVFTPPGSFGSEKIASFGFGKIGVGDTPTQTIELEDFVSGETQSETMKSIPQLELRTSAFSSGSESFEISIPDWLLTDGAKGVRITAGVDRASNKVGNVVIEWNGKEFWNGAPDEMLDVFIPIQYIKKENTFKISAGGIGAAFWAENYYMLNNLNVNLEYGPAKIIVVKLNSIDIESFEKGEIKFYAASTGLLSIKVNGKEIFKKAPRGKYTETFSLSTVPLKVGANIISFTSTTAMKIMDASLRLYMLSNEVSSSKDFNITSKQYDMLKLGSRGKIDIQISRIERPGSLAVKINGNEIPITHIKEGINTVYFSLNDVELGENTLGLSSMGNFDVQDVTISVER